MLRQKQLQSIWEKYYEDCHGLVFVVDSTDTARIEECKQTLGMRPLTLNLSNLIPIFSITINRNCNQK